MKRASIMSGDVDAKIARITAELKDDKYKNIGRN